MICEYIWPSSYHVWARDCRFGEVVWQVFRIDVQDLPTFFDTLALPEFIDRCMARYNRFQRRMNVLQDLHCVFDFSVADAETGDA